MATESNPTTHTFKAEVKQLLYILAHSLYKERDIFLRELISNSSDALTRMHFEMLTNRDVLDPDAELAIHIETPEVQGDAPKRLVIKDSGIGMTHAEMEQNLGTIAQISRSANSSPKSARDDSTRAMLLVSSESVFIPSSWSPKRYALSRAVIIWTPSLWCGFPKAVTNTA